MPTLAAIPVLLTGLYLIAVAAVSFARPERASRFLMGFATSAATHYLELTLRLLVGGAFLLRAPQMLCSNLVTAFGWVLVLTTAGLFLIPWQWHRHFAAQAVPHALRYLKFVAVASLLLGGFVLASLFLGGAR